MDAFTSLLTQIANLLTAAIPLVGIIGVILGGLLIAASAGNPRQMETGKAAIIAAVLGSAIALAARALITLVQNAIPH